MSQFEIRRPYDGKKISINIMADALRGTAYMTDPTTPANAALASGLLLGFVDRDVVTGGPSVVDRAGLFPGRIELPYTTGLECTLEQADAVEAEGSNYLVLSGTGAISSGTAINTKLSFSGGKFYVAQTNDTAYYLLAGLPTPETAGNVRIFATRINN